MVCDPLIGIETTLLIFWSLTLLVCDPLID